MQTQKTKTAQTRDADVVVEEERDTTRTEAVLEECDSCLSDIDDILAEVDENPEVPDPDSAEAIFAKGVPDFDDYYDPDRGGYDWVAYHDAVDAYASAYEEMTGMSYVEEEETTEKYEEKRGCCLCGC